MDFIQVTLMLFLILSVVPTTHAEWPLSVQKTIIETALNHLSDPVKVHVNQFITNAGFSSLNDAVRKLKYVTHDKNWFLPPTHEELENLLIDPVNNMNTVNPAHGLSLAIDYLANGNAPYFTNPGMAMTYITHFILDLTDPVLMTYDSHGMNADLDSIVQLEAILDIMLQYNQNSWNERLDKYCTTIRDTVRYWTRHPDVVSTTALEMYQLDKASIQEQGLGIEQFEVLVIHASMLISLIFDEIMSKPNSEMHPWFLYPEEYGRGHNYTLTNLLRAINHSKTFYQRSTGQNIKICTPVDSASHDEWIHNIAPDVEIIHDITNTSCDIISGLALDQVFPHKDAKKPKWYEFIPTKIYILDIGEIYENDSLDVQRNLHLNIPEFFHLSHPNVIVAAPISISFYFHNTVNPLRSFARKCGNAINFCLGIPSLITSSSPMVQTNLIATTTSTVAVTSGLMALLMDTYPNRPFSAYVHAAFSYHPHANMNEQDHKSRLSLQDYHSTVNIPRSTNSILVENNEDNNINHSLIALNKRTVSTYTYEAEEYGPVTRYNGIDSQQSLDQYHQLHVIDIAIQKNNWGRQLK